MPKPKPRPTPTSLDEYSAKRNFDRTPEPKAGAAPSRKRGGRFVVQKHRARNLHYDLRLELDGTLKSWAVPKGPSLDPAARPLAVQVEDHPLDYADFEGTIPEGQYGGGEVIVWDRGEWEPLNDPHEGLKKGDLKFRLHGERLRGEWALVRMKKRATDRHDRSWLLLKKRDDAATTEDVLAAETSVVSGRTLTDLRAPRKPERRIRIIGAAPSPDPSSSRPDHEPQDTGVSDLEPSRLAGAVKAKQPDSFRPQLATPAPRPPTDDRWVHEVKYDGYRLLAVIKDGRARLLTRTGQDWTATFPPVAAAAAKLPFRDAIVDGEVVVLNARGVPDFQALQNALRARGSTPLVFYAFDLPFAAGWDLRRCALVDRKDLLRRAIDASPGASRTIRFSDHIRGKGPDVLRQALAAGLEGIVSKRADAPYESRRTDTWLKFKGRHVEDFVVVGYTDPERSREAFGALVLARKNAEGRLVYRGRVGTGFDAPTLRDLLARLEPLQRTKPPIPPPDDSTERKGVHWVEPRLVVDVEYAALSRDGRVRHPSYRGLRLDKPADEVEDAEAGPAVLPERPAVVRHSKRIGAADVGGVQITNPDRIVFPDVGVTKLQVAEYYLAASERILPFLVGRPLSLVRHPKGLAERGFFQRHPMESMPDSVGVVTMAGHEKEYLVIRDLHGLMSLVQFGTIEFHPWGCRDDAADHPDLITFDLDPGEGVPWEGVIAAAEAMREYLKQHRITSFVKTSGGKGLHVVAPLDGSATWDDVKEFVRRVADTIARAAPTRFTAASTVNRRGRIYIDYLRNRSGSTSVAAYSLRARPGAPVSMPLAWDELPRCPGPAAYTLPNSRPRLEARRKAPWAALASNTNRLPDGA